MEVIIPKDSAEIPVIAADAVCSLLHRKPNAVIGLATGSSPLPLYAELIRRYEAGLVSFAEATAFTLDEYVGLPAEHPQAYANVIRAEFTSHVDFADDAVHAPNGLANDIDAACVEYEQRIVEAGGVDIQILGLGSGGHIAFNEPASSLASRTRVKTLTPQTRRDNARFFGGDKEQVPLHCITQGLATILEAHHVILIATGQAKAQAVQQMVEGPVSAMWPATILQHHQYASVLLDEDAAGLLVNQAYYRRAYDLKPDWQGIGPQRHE